MATPPSSLAFKIYRHEPELITPASPTPHEFKTLSDIDGMNIIRVHVPLVQFYRPNLSTKGKVDIVESIKKAIAKTLVFYYPLAGRLRERPDGKLMVECNGEGILFTEAFSEASLDDFGDVTQIPNYVSFDQLLFDVPNSKSFFNSPLLLIQVTRLACGGFIFAIVFNHSMTNAFGLAQYMRALTEMVLGADAPSTLPLWKREILRATKPPPNMTSRLQHSLEGAKDIPKDLVDRQFWFGQAEISTLRRLLPPHIRDSCTTFDILSASTWKCRTIAIRDKIEAKEEVTCVVVVNPHGKFDPPIVPRGYYGNVIANPVAIAKAEEVSKNPIEFVVALIRKAKAQVTKEYVDSLVDTIVNNDGPVLFNLKSYVVSDMRNVGFEKVDFGWNIPIYTDLTVSGGYKGVQVASTYTPAINMKGEKMILYTTRLPASSMEIFVKELNNMLGV